MIRCFTAADASATMMLMLFHKPTHPFKELASSSQIRAVAFFTCFYLLVATGLAVWTQNWEFVIYIAVVVVLAGLTMIVRLYSLLSPGVLWGLSIWGIMHMAGGLVPIPDDWIFTGKQALYSWWIIPYYFKFDNLVHAYGFALTTALCWEAMRGTLKDIEPRFGILSLVVLAALGLGALNEVVEYLTTKILPNTNVGGYENTMLDLIWNAIGAIVAACGIALWAPLKAKGMSSDSMMHDEVQ